MFTLFLAVFTLMVQGCGSPEEANETPLTAEDIVDRAIEVHGTDVLENARMTFDFRGRKFVISRNSGLFSYERIFSDSTGAKVQEILSNDGFARFVDGERWNDDDEMMPAWERSVNAVIYFTRLPAPLNDDAVITRLIEETEIDGEPYYEIEVTFRQEGGGRDYEDRFVYWFHAEDFTMDYLAYYYYTDDEGSRFRKAVNRRELNGVLLQDYLNYSGENMSFETVETYDALFNSDELTLVSEIINENTVIELLVSN